MFRKTLTCPFFCLTRCACGRNRSVRSRGAGVALDASVGAVALSAQRRGGDRGAVARELARQAGPFREALKRVAIATKLGRKIDKDRDAEAGGDDLTDEDIVQRLREMGPCPMGFAWHREGSGWRCGGGSHFVHDDDPMLQA